MKPRILALAALLIVALTACSAGDGDSDAAHGMQDKPASDDPQHVWKGQVKALDKARNLENDLDAAQRKRADEIDRQIR